MDWKNKTKEFKTIDVRKINGNFFPGLKDQAEKLDLHQGIEIIQNFEPFPMYGVMESLGFEHFTEKVKDGEYHSYFYRTEVKKDKDNSPFKPIAILNYPIIDENLGEIAMNFWNLTWNSDKRTLPYEIRLLLSLTNAVGAGRIRQATRELIKAYAYGVESPVFDDVFELIAWNQGIGFFSSEIGPSPLFKAYKMIKEKEKQGFSKAEIQKMLSENFGEKNQEVSVG